MDLFHGAGQGDPERSQAAVEIAEPLRAPERRPSFFMSSMTVSSIRDIDLEERARPDLKSDPLRSVPRSWAGPIPRFPAPTPPCLWIGNDPGHWKTGEKRGQNRIEGFRIVGGRSNTGSKKLRPAGPAGFGFDLPQATFKPFSSMILTSGSEQFVDRARRRDGMSSIATNSSWNPGWW